MKKPLVTPLSRKPTAEEQARSKARREEAGWRCECDGEAGRVRCSLPHLTATAGPRCARAGFVLVTETDGRDAVVCEDCAESRHTNALVDAFPQTDLFDLIDDTPETT